jgi:NAD-dependent dihydropyrimidine dehydrogenase PreA subunit
MMANKGKRMNDKKSLEPDKEYLGIPRKEIPWYPSIDDANCDGCGTCIEFCKLGTYSYNDAEDKAQVSNPYNCVVGCNGCEDKCPSEAISFPSTEVIDKVRKKYGV